MMLRRIPPKRRRLGLTNYRKRLKLVKSGMPRLVVRKTNRYIIAQIVESRKGGDLTITSVTSKELSKYGWKAGFKNTPAAYLTGLLLATKSKERGVKDAILDIGLQRPVKGCRAFAVLKGAVDGGLNLIFSEDIVPDEHRISGKHIADYYSSLDQEKREKLFRMVDQEFVANLPDKVKEISSKMMGGTS